MARRGSTPDGGTAPREPWSRFPLVVIAGNAGEVVAALKEGAVARGVKVLDASDAARSVPALDTPDLGSAEASDPAERVRASVAIVAIRPGKRSALMLGVNEIHALQPLLTHDAARIVIEVRERVKLAPNALAQLLTPEILHQIGAALDVNERSRFRNLGLRLGEAMLDAAGMHVFRLGRLNTSA